MNENNSFLKLLIFKDKEEVMDYFDLMLDN